MKKKIPLYVKILGGMLLGIGVGFGAIALDRGGFVQNWVAPFGTIFIRLLKLVAVPLVFLSLLKGISHLQDIRQLSRMGLKTLGIFMCTTVAAILLGLGMVSLLRPGSVFSDEKAEELRVAYGEVVVAHPGNADAAEAGSPLRFLVDVVPDNILAAGADNSRMLQIIFVAILFGVALVALPREKTQAVIDVVDGLNEIILKAIHYIMLFAPYGVMALMAELVVGFAGEAAIFAALGMYILTVALALAILAFLFYPALLKLFTKIPLPRFFKAAAPVQLLAFSTSSSAAALPLTMKQTEDELGVSKDTSAFVLPVGVTINMDGTSCYQAISVIFIAQVLGLDLTVSQMLTIILVTTISSIGTPGVPGGSIVILMMVLGSIGIPSEWLALILGVERPLDMMRTVANVTGNMVVASVVDEGEQKRKSLNPAK